MTDPLLGKAEGQRLEFKRAAILEDLRSLGRAVVGMLNGGGGTIWIGVREEHERAVAYERIDRAEAQARRLGDYFADAIEPAPGPGEVDIDLVPIEGRVMLRIRTRGSGGPYALLRRGGGREYCTRVGARIRPMTRGELTAAFGAGPARGVDALWKTMLEEREAEAAAGFRGLWLRVRPLARVRLSDPGVDLFQEAERSGNRPNGFNFVNPYADPPEVTQQGIRFRWGEDSVDLAVELDGSLKLQVALERLRHADSGRSLWPLALIEHPVAAARLLGRLIESPVEETEALLLDLALLGAKEWTLGPFSPQSAGYRLREHRACPSDAVGLLNPVRFTAAELVLNADGCVHPAIRQLYRAFGYGSEAIPAELDPDSHVLRLE